MTAPRAKDTGEPTCGVKLSGPLPYVCTAPEGHQGDHIAHREDGTVVATWPAEQVPDV